VDISEDDALISGLIKAARETAEVYCRRAFVTQTLELVLERWPCGGTIELGRGPVQSVTGITYKLLGGSVLTLDSGAYVVGLNTQRISLMPGYAWPSDTLYPVEPVRVTYTAGYGAAAAVPQAIKQAVLLLVGLLYEQREAAAERPGQEIPFGVKSLLGTVRDVRY
jgi:uncharacterized phiE125 gp8 family phage protein